MFYRTFAFRHSRVCGNPVTYPPVNIGLAAAFKPAVIAEGVESVEHGIRLLELGCDHAQGYVIAWPMPVEEVPGWIAGWRPPEGWAEQ